MKPLLRKTAELSLVFAVPIVTKANAKTRLCNLQRTLQQIAKESIDALPDLKSIEKAETVEAMDAWGKTAGWLNTPIHVGVLVSFCAEMLELSGIDYDPKLYEIIVDIVDHLIKGNDFEDSYIDEAHEAVLLWLNQINEKEENMEEKKVLEIVEAINGYLASISGTHDEDSSKFVMEEFVNHLQDQLPVNLEEAKLIKQREEINEQLRQITIMNQAKFKVGVHHERSVY
jgi:hypothetical protein